MIGQKNCAIKNIFSCNCQYVSFNMNNYYLYIIPKILD